MKLLNKNVFELIFYTLLGIIFTGLFTISLTQGFVYQLFHQNLFMAFLHYTAALISLIGTIFVVLRAKRVLRILSESDFIYKLMRG